MGAAAAFATATPWPTTCSTWPCLVRDGERVVALVRLALPLQEIDRDLAALRRRISQMTLGTILAALLLAVLIAERTARPVRHLISGMQRVEQGDLNVHVLPSTRDEVGAIDPLVQRHGGSATRGGDGAGPGARPVGRRVGAHGRRRAHRRRRRHRALDQPGCAAPAEHPGGRAGAEPLADPGGAAIRDRGPPGNRAARRTRSARTWWRPRRGGRCCG